MPHHQEKRHLPHKHRQQPYKQTDKEAYIVGEGGFVDGEVDSMSGEQAEQQGEEVNELETAVVEEGEKVGVEDGHQHVFLVHVDSVLQLESRLPCQSRCVEKRGWR